MSLTPSLLPANFRSADNTTRNVTQYWSYSSPVKKKKRNLTKFDVKDTCGRDDLECIGGFTLIITRVSCVQVLDAELGSCLCFADGYPSLLLDHRGIVLQPTDGWSWVSRHFAVQRSRLTLEVGDVVNWLLELQKIPWRKQNESLVEWSTINMLPYCFAIIIWESCHHQLKLSLFEIVHLSTKKKKTPRGGVLLFVRSHECIHTAE